MIEELTSKKKSSAIQLEGNSSASEKDKSLFLNDKKEIIPWINENRVIHGYLDPLLRDYYPEFRLRYHQFLSDLRLERRWKFILDWRERLLSTNNLNITSFEKIFAPKPLLQIRNSCFFNAVIQLLFSMKEISIPIVLNARHVDSLAHLLKEIYHCYSETNLLLTLRSQPEKKVFFND